MNHGLPVRTLNGVRRRAGCQPSGHMGRHVVPNLVPQESALQHRHFTHSPAKLRPKPLQFLEPVHVVFGELQPRPEDLLGLRCFQVFTEVFQSPLVITRPPSLVCVNRPVVGLV